MHSYGYAQRYELIGKDPTGEMGLALTSSASTNTKGSWVEWVAATTFDASRIILMPGPMDPADFLLDVSIGPSGQENNYIILSNLIAGHPNASTYAGQMVIYPYDFPLHIPIGSRISARIQASGGSKAGRWLALLQTGGVRHPKPVTKVSTYGANTSDSGGTSIDPGGTIHTKGAWVEIVAATTRDVYGLIIGIGQQENSIRTWAQWLVDIGIGAEGSEQVAIPDWWIGVSNNNDIITPIASPLFPVYIPAGTRVSVRAACHINDATDRLFDVVLYTCE